MKQIVRNGYFAPRKTHLSIPLSLFGTASPNGGSVRRKEEAMAHVRMNGNKILRARDRIRSGFYRNPKICSTLLDRCVESLVREAALEEEGTPGLPDHGRSAVPVPG